MGRIVQPWAILLDLHSAVCFLMQDAFSAIRLRKTLGKASLLLWEERAVQAYTLQDGAEADALEEQRWNAKSASRRSDVVGALRSGLDRLAEVSNKALTRVGSSDLLHRFWTCLEVCMLVMHQHSASGIAHNSKG